MTATLTRALGASPIFAPRMKLAGSAVAASSVWHTSDITASGTNHVDSAWQEIIAATDAEAEGIILADAFYAASGAQRYVLWDLAIGAASSEVEIISDVMFSQIVGGAHFYLPVRIPKGSRVAHRFRAATGTVDLTGLNVRLIAVDAGIPRPPRRLIAIGTVPASSQGTNLNTAANNTKASWTELTSATTEPLRGFIPCIGGNSAGQQTADALIDIGIGPSGAEVVVCPNLPWRTNGTEQTNQFIRPFVPYPIAKGTRVAARYQRSAAGVVAVSLVGVPA